MSNKKILIAYYSHSGNTKSVAKKIQEITGGDLFKIEPLKPYPNNYNDIVNQAKLEKLENFSPELVENGNISEYDIIYIGTPVWWYTFASPIRTFLKENDFAGKIIMPFCTHGGGGASSTYTDMEKLCPSANIKSGHTLYENNIDLREIKKWIYGSQIL